MVETQLQLYGCGVKSRVVVMRKRIRESIARDRRIGGKLPRLDLAGPSVDEADKLWGYAVLVTDVAHQLVVDQAALP